MTEEQGGDMACWKKRVKRTIEWQCQEEKKMGLGEYKNEKKELVRPVTSLALLLNSPEMIKV